VINKLTDFRLMALLGMPEVIANRQMPRLTLSVIGDQFFGYTRKYLETGRSHQESAAERTLNRRHGSIPARLTSLRSRNFSLGKFKGERWELFRDVIRRRARHFVPKRDSSKSTSLTSLRAVSSESCRARAMR
jgi:hypothetical protein